MEDREGVDLLDVASSTINVEPIGPPPPPSDGAAPAPGEAPSAPARRSVIDKLRDALTSTSGEPWTDADVVTLTGLVKIPYVFAGSRVGGAAGPRIVQRPGEEDPELVHGWFEISDDEALSIAKPLSKVLPVEWIRTGEQKSPIVAGVTAAIAIYVVTKPRLDRLREETNARARAAAASRPRAVAADRPGAEPGGARRDAAARDADGDDGPRAGGLSLDDLGIGRARHRAA